jgi:hypothetical protein
MQGAFTSLRCEPAAHEGLCGKSCQKNFPSKNGQVLADGEKNIPVSPRRGNLGIMTGLDVQEGGGR